MLLEEAALGRPYKVKGNSPEPDQPAAQASGGQRCLHTGAHGGPSPALSLDLSWEVNPSASLFGFQGPRQGLPFHRVGPGGPGSALGAPGHQRAPGQSRRASVGDKEATTARPLPAPPPSCRTLGLLPPRLSSCRSHRGFCPAGANALISLDLWSFLRLYCRDEDEVHHCQTALGTCTLPYRRTQMRSLPRRAAGGSLGTPGQRPGLPVTPIGIFCWSQMSHQGHNSRNSPDLIQAPVKTPQQHRRARWRRAGSSPKIRDKLRMLLCNCKLPRCPSPVKAQPVDTRTKEYRSEYKGVSQLSATNSDGARRSGCTEGAATKSGHGVIPLCVIPLLPASL